MSQGKTIKCWWCGKQFTSEEFSELELSSYEANHNSPLYEYRWCNSCCCSLVYTTVETTNPLETIREKLTPYQKFNTAKVQYMLESGWVQYGTGWTDPKDGYVFEDFGIALSVQEGRDKGNR
jgi:hypothetical protein